MLNSQMNGQQDLESYKERISRFSKDFEIGLFLNIAVRNLPWVALFFLISISGAYLYLRYTPPIYESKTILQIQNQDSEKQILDLSGVSDEGNGIDQAIELIRSPRLFELAVKKLPLSISYFIEGDILSENKYPNRFFDFDDLIIKDSSILGKKIYFDFSEKGYTCEIELNEGNTLSFQGVEFDAFDCPYFSFSLRQNNPEEIKSILQSKNRIFIVFNHPDYLVRELLHNFSVTLLNANANTIQISFKDRNPHFARDIVNAVAETFKEFDLEKRNESNNRILQFLEDQIDTVYQQLKSSEFQIQAFRQANRIKDFEGTSKNYLERITDLETDLLNEEIEERILQEIESSSNTLKSDRDVYNLLSVVSGSRYEASLKPILEQLHKLMLQKQEETFSSTDKSTYMKSLDHRINLQASLVKNAIQSIRNQAEKRKNTISERLGEYESVYYGLPEKELEYARLERLFSINEKYHSLLLEKRTQYAISIAGNTPMHEILEKAEIPKDSVSPKRRMVYVSFFALGLLLSLGLIVGKYVLHNEIASLHEIDRLANSSVGKLGIIPKFKQNIPVSQLLVDKNPKSMISEAFRTLRTNLQFINNSPGPKTMGITSTISGEGKTFVSINLAGILAYSGKKVIILDLDMRKPKIHLGFGVGNEKGMSTILIGKESINDCIRESDLNNLFYITAGPVPPNPSELIINGQLDELVKDLKTKFDYIIFDMPPVGLVTDGLPVFSKVDYPLYVFRANYSKKNFVQNVDRLINENNINGISVVLNGVDLEKSSYGYNYGYGYGYGYGYTYGDNYYSDPGSSQANRKGILSKIFKKRK